MKVIVFGATGMVGQGVLRESLLAPDVSQVLAVGRTATGQRHRKLDEIVVPDVADLSTVEERLAGYDACFFCLGVSSVGMAEEEYRKITYDTTIAVAGTLARTSPGIRFVYVSGAGTDSEGRSMWARVKGRTENDLLAMDGLDAYMFRPGFIQAMHGIRPKSRVYRIGYAVVAPVFPLFRRFGRLVTTTEKVGLAMVEVARGGSAKRVLETADINAAANG